VSMPFSLQYYSNQHVLKMSAVSTHACFESCTPLVNGSVDGALFNAVPSV